MKMAFHKSEPDANCKCSATYLVRDSQYQFDLQNCRGRRWETKRIPTENGQRLSILVDGLHKTHPNTLSKSLYIHSTVASCRTTENPTQNQETIKSLSVSRIRYDAPKLLNGGCGRIWLRSEQLCTTVRGRCGYWLMQ
jgi:hypothetical protein